MLERKRFLWAELIVFILLLVFYRNLHGYWQIIQLIFIEIMTTNLFNKEK